MTGLKRFESYRALSWLNFLDCDFEGYCGYYPVKCQTLIFSFGLASVIIKPFRFDCATNGLSMNREKRENHAQHGITSAAVSPAGRDFNR